MSIKISDLTAAANLSTSDLIPILVNTISRRTTLFNPLQIVTGGTVTGITGGANITSSSVSASGGATQAVTISFNLPGMIVPFAGLAAKVPLGWLFCNGQAVSRSFYAALFGVTGVSYGAGNGTTTFNLPDLRGRIPFGAASGAGAASPLNGATFASGNFYSLGSAGGTENHLITESQTPLKSHTHAASGTVTVFGNSHDTQNFDDPDVSPPENYTDLNYLGEVAPGSRQSAATSVTTPALTGANATVAHNNMPPAIVLSYLIKA